MVREEKRIGTYSEKNAKKYFKIGLLFLIPFSILWLTSIRRLPLYVNVGGYENLRGFVSGVLATFGLFFMERRAKTWISGLNGERAVVQNVSDKLSSDYSIFNDVMLDDGKRSGNVDHIIVGPTGIFAIETKNNEGTVTYDDYGWKGIRSPSGQAISNAVRVRDVLESVEVFKRKDLYVNAVVVFTNRKIRLTVSKKPENFTVVQLREQTDSSLCDYVKNEPIRFSGEEVRSIEQCLKASIREM